LLGGMNASRFRSSLVLLAPLKLDHAKKVAMIGNGNRRHPKATRLGDERLNPRRAIEQTVLGMQMKMNERRGGHGAILVAGQRQDQRGGRARQKRGRRLTLRFRDGTVSLVSVEVPAARRRPYTC